MNQEQRDQLEKAMVIISRVIDEEDIKLQNMAAFEDSDQYSKIDEAKELLEEANDLIEEAIGAI